MNQDSQLHRQRLRLEIARIRRRLDSRLRAGAAAPITAFASQTQRGSFWSTVALAAASLAMMLATRRGRSELPRALPRIFADLLAAWFNRTSSPGAATEQKV